MTIHVEAIMQDGLLRPKRPIALPDGTEVKVTIDDDDSVRDPLATVIGIGEGPENGDVAERHDDHLYGRG